MALRPSFTAITVNLGSQLINTDRQGLWRGLKGLKGMARPIACTVNLESNGGNIFTDVAGLLLR